MIVSRHQDPGSSHRLRSFALSLLFGLSLYQTPPLEATSFVEEERLHARHQKADPNKAYWEELNAHLAERGTSPHEDTLGKLLGNERIMTCLASSLSLQEFSALGRTCLTAHFFYDRALTQTDFLTAHGAYAEEIRGIFKDVTFTPPLEALRISQLVINDYESLRVHFRDVTHLEEIAKKIPFIRSKVLYFIKNERAKTPTCFMNSNGPLSSCYTFNLFSNTPLHLQGRISTPLILTLPGESEFANMAEFSDPISPHLFPDAKSLFDVIEMSSSPFFVAARHIISYYKQLDENPLPNRLNEIVVLLKARQSERQTNPEKYPPLDQLESCDAYIYNDARKFNLSQLDCISFEKPLLYKAPTFEEFQKLSEAIPSVECLKLIDPSNSESGIYGDAPFDIRIRYRIRTTNHLLLSGQISTPNDYLFIEAGNLWLVNCYLEARFVQSSTSARCFNLEETKTKPDDMPQELWDDLLDAKLPWHEGLF